MTLVAYRLDPSAVEIVADSLAYTADASLTRPTSKLAYFAHVDTAVVATGDATVSDLLRSLLFIAAGADVDDVARHIQEQLPGCWEYALREASLRGGDAPSAVVLAFGYSTKARRFVGYEFHCGEDTPERIRFKAIDVRVGGRAEGDPLEIPFGGRFKVFPEQRPLAGGAPRSHPVPTSIDEWVELGLRVRAGEIDRPVEHRVLIGSHLTYTRLGPAGVCTQQRIHTFDDTGEEFARLVAGTANPDGAPTKVTGVGRNDPCFCGSGRKFKYCHDPRAVV